MASPFHKEVGRHQCTPWKTEEEIEEKSRGQKALVSAGMTQWELGSGGPYSGGLEGGRQASGSG